MALLAGPTGAIHLKRSFKSVSIEVTRTGFLIRSENQKPVPVIIMIFF